MFDICRMSVYKFLYLIFLLCFFFDDVSVRWHCHIHECASFLMFVFNYVWPMCHNLSMCVYLLISQHCHIVMFTYWLLCVCVCVRAVFLSFRCAVICILNNVNVRQLNRVSLSTHSLPQWGIWRLCGQ